MQLGEKEQIKKNRTQSFLLLCVGVLLAPEKEVDFFPENFLTHFSFFPSSLSFPTDRHDVFFCSRGTSHRGEGGEGGVMWWRNPRVGDIKSNCELREVDKREEGGGGGVGEWDGDREGKRINLSSNCLDGH